MNNALEWSQLFANIVPTLISVLTMVGGILYGFYKFIERRYEGLEMRVAKVEQFDSEFKVMRNQLENVQSSVEGLKQDVKDNAEQQRQDLNGGLERMQKTMQEYAKAVAGKA